MKDRRRGLRMAVIAAAWLVLAALPAQARPPHKKALADYLGPGLARKLNDCRTCHLAPEQGADASEDRPHNAFGKRLKAVRAELRKAGQPSGIPARLQAVAGEDSDGDGVANLLELVTGHFPGEADDRPAASELARGRATIAALERSRSGYPVEPVRAGRSPDGPGRPRPAATAIRNPIDAFIAAEQAARGLTPRPEASRPVLLRRVTLDLTGLPPTPDELHAFLDDDGPDAYEKVVDRLLDSPRYGERWGRHWMDVWRYSDWAGWGQQVRDSQPHIWHWRDWIVESLNRDKPYDRMVVEMLAADEESSRRPRCPPRHRLPRAELQAAQPREVDAGRGRPHRPGLPGRDDRLRPLPRPHVRPDPPEGVLPGPRDLRAAPGPDRSRPRRARHQEGRHPPRLRRSARREDAALHPRRRPLPDRRSARARRARIAGRLARRQAGRAAPRRDRARPPQGRDPRRDRSRCSRPSARAEAALAEESERPSQDPDAIERARQDARPGPGPTRRPNCGRAGRGAGRPGQEGLEGVDGGGRIGDGRPARAGGRAGEPGRGRWRGRRGDSPPRRSGPRPTRPSPMPSRPWRWPRTPPGSRRARPMRPRRGRPIRPPARADGWPSPAGSPTSRTR